MREIESIKNITVSQSLAGVQGVFHHTIKEMPIHPVDEVVISAVTWSGRQDDIELYLLWSNIENNFVTSFTGSNTNPHFPNTRIIWTKPPPNVLEFKLYHPQLIEDVPPFFCNNVDGEIAIHLEFITYKKNH